MRNRRRQTKLFALMFEKSGIPALQQPKIMQVFDSFFDLSWPSSDFTVGMCALVAEGILPYPPPFRETARVELYKAQSRNLQR